MGDRGRWQETEDQKVTEKKRRRKPYQKYPEDRRDPDGNIDPGAGGHTSGNGLAHACELLARMRRRSSVQARGCGRRVGLGEERSCERAEEGLGLL